MTPVTESRFFAVFRITPEVVAKRTGLAESAWKEDSVELDSTGSSSPALLINTGVDK